MKAERKQKEKENEKQKQSKAKRASALRSYQQPHQCPRGISKYRIWPTGSGFLLAGDVQLTGNW